MDLYEFRKLFNKKALGKLSFYDEDGTTLSNISDSLFFEFHFYRDKYSELFDRLEEENMIAYNGER